MPKPFSYNKIEKLKSKKELDILFAKGKSFLIFPLKVFYNLSTKENDNNINCGVGVSKRNFKNATDRNRIKRLLRENYRLNKLPLHESITAKQLSFFILFIDKIMPQKRIELDEKMQLVIAKLIKRYSDEMAC